MRPIIEILLWLLQLYVWLIIITAVMSWLITFNVINMRNDLVRMIWDSLTRLTEPVLRPIRERLPNMGGVDISPLVVILLIWLISREIETYIYPYVP
jgi:YggT family protein